MIPDYEKILNFNLAKNAIEIVFLEKLFCDLYLNLGAIFNDYTMEKLKKSVSNTSGLKKTFTKRDDLKIKKEDLLEHKLENIKKATNTNETRANKKELSYNDNVAILYCLL